MKHIFAQAKVIHDDNFFYIFFFFYFIIIIIIITIDSVKNKQLSTINIINQPVGNCLGEKEVNGKTLI